MSTEPLNVTDEAFEQVVLQNDKPVVVDFWAPWCGPCKMVAPVLDKLAAEHGENLVIAKVNTDDHPMWAQKYQVQGIPTMLFVHDGKVVHRQTGALPEGPLRQVVNHFLEAVEPEAAEAGASD